MIIIKEQEEEKEVEETEEEQVGDTYITNNYRTERNTPRTKDELEYDLKMKRTELVGNSILATIIMGGIGLIMKFIDKRG